MGGGERQEGTQCDLPQTCPPPFSSYASDGTQSVAFLCNLNDNQAFRNIHKARKGTWEIFKNKQNAVNRKEIVEASGCASQ